MGAALTITKGTALGATCNAYAAGFNIDLKLGSSLSFQC